VTAPVQVEVTIVEQWGVAQYGLLHAPSVDQRFDTQEEANAYCDDKDWVKSTPVRRRAVTIDGVEYGSAWFRVPTEQQRAKHPAWPAEVVLA
jgi:hypothetical protein